VETITAFPPSIASAAVARALDSDLRRDLTARPGRRDRLAADEALVQAIATGDAWAMRVLFDRHKDRVFRFILRMVGDRALAEDLLSEVFIDVWLGAGQFAGRSRVSTWLLGIARYKALTAISARRPEQLDDEVAHAIVDPGADPEAELAGKQRAGAVRRAIDSLAAQHREIIELVYGQGRTIAEIAELLRIPANTVKTRMFNARRRLAALIAPRLDAI